MIFGLLMQAIFGFALSGAYNQLIPDHVAGFAVMYGLFLVRSIHLLTNTCRVGHQNGRQRRLTRLPDIYLKPSFPVSFFRMVSEGRDMRVKWSVC